LGFDTSWRNDYSDAVLVQLSGAERRILLTRDRELLKRSAVTHGYWIRETQPSKQLVEVVRRFDLFRVGSPLSALPPLQHPLEEVDKASVDPRLPPKIRERHSEVSDLPRLPTMCIAMMPVRAFRKGTSGRALVAKGYPSSRKSEGGRIVFRRALTAAIGCLWVFMNQPAAAASVDLRAQRNDGSLIYWSLDRQHRGPKQGILVLAQGSGCLAATENPNTARAKGLLPDFAVVTVEKYGAHPHDKPKEPFGGCSPEFYAHHTVSQRVADYQKVLAAVRKSPWWDGRLVLFGGSEGGAAMSMLAPLVKPTAVVLFSSAAGRSFREMFKLVVPPEVARQADSEFAKIKANPLSSKVWGGNSYRWYADILDRDLTADLLSIRAPILIVHGERDRSGPVQVARTVRDDFQREGHCNLTYWEFQGYDHHMQDAAGTSHIDEVLHRISGWLVSKVSGEPSEGCPQTEQLGRE
jgi:pimeloyl-ACP methyl ester carboxylesterase